MIISINLFKKKSKRPTVMSRDLYEHDMKMQNQIAGYEKNDSVSKLIANESNSSGLHTSPTILAVSESGERTLHRLDENDSLIPISTNKNPFNDDRNQKNNINDIDFIKQCSSNELRKELPDLEFLEKCSSKERRQLQKRRKSYSKRIKSARAEKRSRSVTDTKLASVQTDNCFRMDFNVSREYIGDVGKLSKSCCQLCSLRQEDRMSKIAESELKCPQKIPASIKCSLLTVLKNETLRILTSYVLMLVMVFWLTSIVLDIEIPSELFQIGMNYLKSFQYIYEQKPPKTFLEKLFEYIQKIFE